MSDATEAIHEHEVHNMDLSTTQSIITFDTLGIAASSLCLVHCLAMPFVISFLPLLGWQFLEGKLAHEVLAGFVFSFAVFGIVPSYIKYRQPGVLIGMIVGLMLVLTATCFSGVLFAESIELPLITLGNLILVGTHWVNKHLVSCTNHKH